jgi:hypothetical protein
MFLGRRIPEPVRRAVLAGFISGLVGALAFAAAHAVIIVPIWTRMGSGLAFGALAGASAGWALVELHPSVPTASRRTAAALGAGFGAVLWLLVTPVTAADALLRAVGIARRYELVAVGVALVLAIGAGAAYGWRRSHRKGATIAAALATLTLTLGMAGPVPVANSARAFGIFLAVLPAAALAGAVLALLVRWLARRGAPKAADTAGA